jgi:uncharacterized membrane protein
VGRKNRTVPIFVRTLEEREVANIPQGGRQRLIPLDALRGLIMMLMAVDHANYFVAKSHPTGEFWGISLPRYESAWAFLTRVITHPCAPGFFFLMAVSMILFRESRTRHGWTEGRIRRHLLTRGLILIGLQFFLENPAWAMGPSNRMAPPGEGGRVWIHFGVLFALGSAMIIAALFLRAKSSLILGASVAVLIGTHLLIPDASLAGRPFAPWLRILFIPGKTGSLQVFYPALPWLSITGFGLVFGRWIRRDDSEAYQRGLLAGLIMLGLFALLRMLNLGDFHRLESAGWMEVLNVTKYPPSAAYIFLTLGTNLLALYLISRIRTLDQFWSKPLLVFGRTALFFYLAHMYFFALAGFFFPKGSGFFIMYAVWLGSLVVLYPLCAAYLGFKQRQPVESIWRFF